MGQVTTSHYKIFDYWKDKIIRKDGTIGNISDAYELEDNIVVDDDYYYPRCWGCGKRVVRDSRADEWISKQCIDGDETSNLKRIWNSKETRSKLNRCHIVPAQLGGDDTPSNLFLMCEECHVLSPDTIYSTEFHKWVLERRKQMTWGNLHPNYIFEQVDGMLRQELGFGIVQLCDEIHRLGGSLSSDDFKEILHKRIGTHGSKVSDSSKLLAVKHWLVSTYLDLLLK